MDERDRLINAALDIYPIAPLPAGFVRRTMKQIRAPAPRFRLEFVDVAIPLFMAVFLAILTIIAFWLVDSANPLWLLGIRTRLEWVRLYTATRPAWPLAALGLLAAAAAGALLLLLVSLSLPRAPRWQLITRPQPSSKRLNSSFRRI